MNNTITVAALALAALGLAAAPAMAQDAPYRPLTVAPHHGVPPAGYGYGYAPQPRSAYNPYGGPGVFVTAPVHAAGTLAVLPFRAVNSVFPARGNTPLTLVGAPVYALGKLVELPFRLIEAPFGGPSPFVD